MLKTARNTQFVYAENLSTHTPPVKKQNRIKQQQQKNYQTKKTDTKKEKKTKQNKKKE